MKIQALVLGKYDTTSTFRLYRFPIPVSPPLNSPISTSPTKIATKTTQVKSDQCVMYYYCLEDLERLAILAPVSSLRHVNTVQLYRGYPSAFCKNVIDGYTYANIHVLYELATCLKSTLLMDLCQLTEHSPLAERYSLLQRIPLLDTTPSPVLLPSLSSLFSKRLPVQLVEQVLHPVRLDGQEWFLQPWIQQHEQHQRLSPPQDKYIPKVRVVDMDSRTKESSLLLQRRLAPKLGHHAPHLTIHTPTYKDQYHLHSIQSAPLRKSIYKQQINKRLQAAAVAAAATTDTNPHSSPSSAAMASRIYWHHESTQVTPQKNLGPSPPTLRIFEQLHDTLEHTRAQKSTLDDTIRQTSVILGKSQQFLTPQTIHDQVTKQMGVWMSPYLDQMEQCMGRLLTLETKMADKQQQQIPAAKTIDKTTMKMELLALMNRLDQLERRKPTPALTEQ